MTGSPGRHLGGLLPAVVLGAGSCAQAATGLPPNYVEITPRLATSGQPASAFLEVLKTRGFEVVIYIAPPTVANAVKEEPLVVGRQGPAYANIPVDFGAPTQADFEAFTGLLAAYAGRNILVHCQANLRASSFVFLHRVIHGRESPDAAWESVRRMWEPDPVWRAFILATLRRHAIAYEPI